MLLGAYALGCETNDEREEKWPRVGISYYHNAYSRIKLYGNNFGIKDSNRS